MQKIVNGKLVDMTREEKDALLADQKAALDEQAAYVPPRVTPYQARKALSDAGIRQQVEAAVAASPLEVQDAWEYATTVERNSPMIAALAAGLGLTDNQVDELFRSAALIA